MVSMQAYIKAITGGAILCIGGPALVMWVTPTEEEIFKRYSPQLQKEALARRESTQQGFVDFTTQLKEASKSNKSIWIAQKDIDAQRSEGAQQARRMEYEASTAEIKKRQEEVRASTQ